MQYKRAVKEVLQKTQKKYGTTLSELCHIPMFN